MKNITLFLIITLGILLGSCKKDDDDPNPNTFTDARDGQSYAWVELDDGKKWMAENLNYETIDSWCYNEEENNCNTYGRLYTWDAALSACPDGWHLPSDIEWSFMANKYGGYYDSIENDGDGEDTFDALIEGGTSGFEALFGGVRFTDSSFVALDLFSIYWTSTESTSDDALTYGLYKAEFSLVRSGADKVYGLSCRCVED